MSERAKDVVRYIKVVEQIEDGERERYRILYVGDGTWTDDGMWIPPPGWIAEDFDYGHARMLDALDPVQNAIAAMRYAQDRYGPVDQYGWMPIEISWEPET